jgi:hypothetical protein
MHDTSPEREPVTDGKDLFRISSCGHELVPRMLSAPSVFLMKKEYEADVFLRINDLRCFNADRWHFSVVHGDRPPQ